MLIQIDHVTEKDDDSCKMIPLVSVETNTDNLMQSKKVSNDQELLQSFPTSCPQNQKGNN